MQGNEWLKKMTRSYDTKHHTLLTLKCAIRAPPARLPSGPSMKWLSSSKLFASPARECTIEPVGFEKCNP